MRALLGLFFSFVLLTTGSTLRCEVCYETGTQCTGVMQTCPPKKDTCVIAYTESTLDGKMVRTIEKGCESSDICSSSPFMLYLGDRKSYRTILVCCNEDTCGKVSPKLPPMDNKANGRQCPSCYSWSEGCSIKMVNCTGKDTHCFEMSSQTFSGGIVIDSTIKGCTSKSVCTSMKNGRSPIVGGVDFVKTAECTPDVSRGSPCNSPLLLIVPGILLKVLL